MANYLRRVSDLHLSGSGGDDDHRALSDVPSSSALPACTLDDVLASESDEESEQSTTQCVIDLTSEAKLETGSNNTSSYLLVELV